MQVVTISINVMHELIQKAALMGIEKALKVNVRGHSTLPERNIERANNIANKIMVDNFLLLP